ncbi:MAG: Uma2 family endonuclease [Cyanobacteria bacterium P01_G01_bin.49]
MLLIIEIFNSTSETDLGKKRKIYAANNITEYWVIDMKQNNLIMFRETEQNDYGVKQKIKPGNITLISFPAISISVAKLMNPS